MHLGVLFYLNENKNNCHKLLIIHKCNYFHSVILIISIQSLKKIIFEKLFFSVIFTFLHLETL